MVEGLGRAVDLVGNGAGPRFSAKASVHNNAKIAIVATTKVTERAISEIATKCTKGKKRLVVKDKKEKKYELDTVIFKKKLMEMY